jgi:hypothetical protein
LRSFAGINCSFFNTTIRGPGGDSGDAVITAETGVNFVNSNVIADDDTKFALAAGTVNSWVSLYSDTRIEGMVRVRALSFFTPGTLTVQANAGPVIQLTGTLIASKTDHAISTPGGAKKILAELTSTVFQLPALQNGAFVELAMAPGLEGTAAPFSWIDKATGLCLQWGSGGYANGDRIPFKRAFTNKPAYVSTQMITPNGVAVPETHDNAGMTVRHGGGATPQGIRWFAVGYIDW